MNVPFSLRELAATVAVGMVLTVGLLWPALSDLDGNVPGVYHAEHTATAWQFYRGQEILVEDRKFPIAYPDTTYREGGRLYPLCLLNLLLTLPFHPFMEACGVHSVSLALNLLLAFVFAALLLRSLSGCWWAALPGALLFALSPYMVSHLIYGPPECSTMAWIALALLAGERLAAAERMRPGLAVLAGVTVALSFANSPYNGVFAALALTFAMLTRQGMLLRPLRRTIQLGIAMAVAAALIAPMAAAIRHTLGHPHTMVPGRKDRIDAGMHGWMIDESAVQDLGAFLLPTHRFLSETYQEVMYLGLVAFVVALVAMVRVCEARRWGWLMIGGLIFCLGGTLKVLGYAPEAFGGPLRLPASLLCRLPLLDAISHPYRFAPVVLLAMGAAIALLLRRRAASGQAGAEPGRPRRWQSLVLSAVIVVDLGLMHPEGAFRVPVQHVIVPDFYRQLGEDQGDYGVLDVPVPNKIFSMGLYFLYQLAHDKFVPYDLNSANLDRYGEGKEFAEGLILPSERLFRVARHDGDFECGVTRCDGAVRLAQEGFRYLVLHREGVPAVDAALTECVERCLPAPVHVDEQVRVYEFASARRASAPPGEEVGPDDVPQGAGEGRELPQQPAAGELAGDHLGPQVEAPVGPP